MSNVEHETEVWGLLSTQEFPRKLTEFTQQFGAPKEEKRLILQVTDFDRKDLDTRIRITNRKPVLIQKHGDWNAAKRQEVTLNLPTDAGFIARLYQMLGSMLASDNIQRIIMQLENYVFTAPEFEVKLSRQFGASEVFSFEVEQLKDGINLEKTCLELGLTPDLTYKDDIFWKDYSAKVNLDAANLSEVELAAIINRYLG